MADLLHLLQNNMDQANSREPLSGKQAGQQIMELLQVKKVEVEEIERASSGSEPEAEIFPKASTPVHGASFNARAGRLESKFIDANSNSMSMTSTTNGDCSLPKEWAGISTVMVQNLANKITQQMLRDEIHAAGYVCLYDFLYLPIDADTGANKGYAFVNFIGPEMAWAFKVAFEGRKVGPFNSHKRVAVVPATLQGFDMNYAHYANARVNRGDPETRPLFLRAPSPDVEETVKQKATRQPQQNRRQQQPQQQPQDFACAPPCAPTCAPPMTMPYHTPIEPATYMWGVQAPIQQDPGPVVYAMGGAQPIPSFCTSCGNSMPPAHNFCSCCGNPRYQV